MTPQVVPYSSVRVTVNLHPYHIPVTELAVKKADNLASLSDNGVTTVFMLYMKNNPTDVKAYIDVRPNELNQFLQEFGSMIVD